MLTNFLFQGKILIDQVKRKNRVNVHFCWIASNVLVRFEECFHSFLTFFPFFRNGGRANFGKRLAFCQNNAVFGGGTIKLGVELPSFVCGLGDVVNNLTLKKYLVLKCLKVHFSSVSVWNNF